jgi:hypothetical protein
MSWTVRCSGSVEMSETVKAATSVVGVPNEKRAVQCGSLGYPPQARQASSLEPPVA